MADISAIFGSLLIFGITFPGMLTAWWLLFPASVERARQRLEKTPWQCFWFGMLILFLTGLPSFILLALPFGPAKFLGWLIIASSLAVSSLGASGIAAKMGERLAQKSNASPVLAFVQGALVLEMAVFFPLLGWLLAFPATVITALGATGFALLRWSAHTANTKVVESTPLPA